jgi:hypothetical protein
VTIGLLAGELMGYLILVKKLPVLRAVTGAEAGSGAAAGPPYQPA